MPDEGATPDLAGDGGDSRQPKLDKVDKIVAVVSGKGGVGKSTVATNLAVALSRSGCRVGLADVDIYGPSLAVMLGINGLPQADEDTRLIKPLEAHGLEVMSMGFFLDDEAPVVWRGPMVMSATKQFLRGVAWGELDYLIVDLPPGTGDIPLTLAQEVPVDGAVVVTTPQDVALADVTRSAAMLRRLNMPILGVVDNMAGYVCPSCGTRDDVFGDYRGADLAAGLGTPLLVEIPIVQRVREGGDAGTPIVAAAPDDPASKPYLELAAKVQEAFADGRGGVLGPEPTDVSCDEAAGIVRIAWSDGSNTQYTFSGLRGWCPCAECQGHSGQFGFVRVDDPKLDSVEGVGRYALRLTWADGHSIGMYSYSWLREIADFEECKTGNGGA